MQEQSQTLRACLDALHPNLLFLWKEDEDLGEARGASVRAGRPARECARAGGLLALLAAHQVVWVVRLWCQDGEFLSLRLFAKDLLDLNTERACEAEDKPGLSPSRARTLSLERFKSSCDTKYLRSSNILCTVLRTRQSFVTSSLADILLTPRHASKARRRPPARGQERICAGGETGE